MDGLGTYQIVSDRRERQHTHIEWEACNGHLAGYLVSGISEHETEEEGPSYDTRGENVNSLRHEERTIRDEDTATRDSQLLSPVWLEARHIRVSDRPRLFLDPYHYQIPWALLIVKNGFYPAITDLRLLPEIQPPVHHNTRLDNARTEGH